MASIRRREVVVDSIRSRAGDEILHKSPWPTSRPGSILPSCMTPNVPFMDHTFNRRSLGAIFSLVFLGGIVSRLQDVHLI